MGAAIPGISSCLKFLHVLLVSCVGFCNLHGKFTAKSCPIARGTSILTDASKARTETEFLLMRVELSNRRRTQRHGFAVFPATLLDRSFDQMGQSSESNALTV
jgi:hypothetical protein